MKNLFLLLIYLCFVKNVNAQCQDSVVLNTGYNHSNGSTYGIGDFDPYWQITQVPTNCVSGFNPPNPSIIILKDGSWATAFGSSGWISFRSDASFSCNNTCTANQVSYRFERTFCIKNMDSVIINLKMRFDNSACAFIDGAPLSLGNFIVNTTNSTNFITDGTPSSACPACNLWNDTHTFTSSYETRVDNYKIKLNSGTHRLVVELRNISGQSMGLNLFGSIRSQTIKQNFLCPDSCQRNGTISILKVEDKNCNGLIESGEAGDNWQFVVTGPGGFNQTISTDNSGFAFVNNLTNFGNYIITETNKPGWYPNNPSSGSLTINISNNQPVKATFFNCPGSPSCCPVFRSIKDSVNCSLRLIRQQDPCADSIRSITIKINNGTIGSGGISSSCTGLVFNPTSYISQSAVSITNICSFNQAGHLLLDLEAIDCQKPVIVTFQLTMVSGKVCPFEEVVKCACPPNPPCCAKVEPLFSVCEPNHDLLHGKFTITNLDPTSPICKVIINASPSASFSNSGLMIDGTTKPGSYWNPMMIPSSGVISPAAVNTIMFSLAVDKTYAGNLQITVLKCDSTMCTFPIKWKGKSGPSSTIKPVQIPVQIESGYGLSAYQFQLKGSGNNPIAAKYCSIGLDTPDMPTIFAISGAMHSSDSFPNYLEPVELAQMGNNNAFFGLCCPRPLKNGETSGLFNLVLKVKKEKGKTTPLRITLFDDEGGIIYSDTLIVNNLTTDVSTSIIEIDDKDHPFDKNLFSVYPNPAANDLTIEYILGKAQMVKLELFNSSGILVKELLKERKSEGLHQMLLNISNLPPGSYIIKMHTDNGVSNVKFEVVK